jgi:hypothetical protein
MRRAILIALALASSTATALASPNCLQSGGRGLRIEFGIGTGNFSEQDKMDFLVREARRRGIDAQTAERTWLNCIKVTRMAGGRWVTEYYDPYTWDLVD